MIDIESEELLTFYFGAGRSMFERSTFGAQLERAELFGHGSVKCGTCRGIGVLPTGAWCGPCNGTGAKPYKLPPLTSSDVVVDVSETNTEGGYAPNDDAMAQFAVVSRRVGALPVLLQSALAAYYGDAGIRCSTLPCWRMVSLYPLVPAGKKLAAMGLEELSTEEERLKFDTDPPYERCRRHVELEKSNSKDHRRALIESAERQASELFERTVAAWMALGSRGAA